MPRHPTEPAEPVQIVQRTPPIMEAAGAGAGAPLAKRWPFVLIWRPNRITSMHGKAIPNLEHLELQPGVAGVRQLKDGRWDVRGLTEDLTQSGAKLLPLSLGYCVESKPGTDHWVPVWARTLADGTVIESGKKCEQLYVEMLERWMAQEVIPRPTEDEVARHNERIVSLAASHATSPGHQHVAKTIAALEIGGQP